MHGGVNEPPSWSRFMDYWAWLDTNVHEPKLFVGCAWEDYHPKMSQMILKQEKIEANIQNAHGATALHQSEQNGHVETTEMLLKNEYFLAH